MLSAPILRNNGYLCEMKISAYRPHNPGHDYYGRGTYLITLVVSGREQLLSRFSATCREALNDACVNGTLLILAPWDLDMMGCVNGVPSDSDYSRFHNLNKLAAEICSFNGEARILKD